MQSQSSDIKTVAASVEIQTKSVMVNNITASSTNNQNGTMTKRKQPVLVPMRKFVSTQHNTATTDLTVVNRHQLTGMHSISTNSPTKHPTQNKSQQISSVLQMPPMTKTVPRVSPNNGRNDITDDQNGSYPAYQVGPPYAPSSPIIPISISSPHIGSQHPNFHNYQRYQHPPPVQQSHLQTQSNPTEVGNRQNFSSRQNNSNNLNKKSWNSTYTKSKRAGNNSALSDKNYIASNINSNSNNHNNINNEYSNINKSVRNNRNKSYNCETTKNTSPARDNYSSSSSSSSSSSVPLSKKSIHRHHSPIIPQLNPSISFKGDSRSAPITYHYDQDCYSVPWPLHSPTYADESVLPYELNNNQFYAQGLTCYDAQSSQFHGMNPYLTQNGHMMNIKPSNYPRNSSATTKGNRGNRKNGTCSTNNNKYTIPDRYMHHAPHVEIKDTPNNLKNGSNWDKLSTQVWNKFVASQQKQGTYKWKIETWKNIYCTVMEKFPNYVLYVVGSTISGFGSDASDVDMCLVHVTKNPPIISNERFESTRVLQDFQLVLQGKAIYRDFHLIHAKVPILRFKDTFHDFEIDLNYNNSVGVQNTHLMHCYGQMDWRLRPLALVVKLWAQFHHINNAKESTISSYSLVLMVIHFLQYAVKPSVLPCLHEMYPNKFVKQHDVKHIHMNEDLSPYFSQNTQPLGELFLQFFHYYTHFDFSTYAISVRKASIIRIDECRTVNMPKNDPSLWKELCIEEPFDFTNTAHSCYDPQKFECIKYVFAMSWEALNATKDLHSIFNKPFMPLSM